MFKTIQTYCLTVFSVGQESGLSSLLTWNQGVCRDVISSEVWGPLPGSFRFLSRIGSLWLDDWSYCFLAGSQLLKAALSS